MIFSHFRTTISGMTAATAAVFFLTTETAQAGSDPFLGEIQETGIFGFCPRGWLPTDGQLLPISQNQALFSLLGTTFGGDGRTTFALPDLRSRIPVHIGTGPGLPTIRGGEKLGRETAPLSVLNMTPHSHTVNATNADGNYPGPGNKLLAAAPPSGAGTETIYSDQPGNVTMNPAMIANTGLGQPIPVNDASQTIRYCIATTIGTYPSRP